MPTREAHSIPGTSLPIACTLDAFDDETTARYRVLLSGLKEKVLRAEALPDGYAFTLPSDAQTCYDAMAFTTLERRCCAFLTFTLTVAPAGGPLTLALQGPEGSGTMLREIFEDFPWLNIPEDVIV